MESKIQPNIITFLEDHCIPEKYTRNLDTIVQSDEFYKNVSHLRVDLRTIVLEEINKDLQQTEWMIAYSEFHEVDRIGGFYGVSKCTSELKIVAKFKSNYHVASALIGRLRFSGLREFSKAHLMSATDGFSRSGIDTEMSYAAKVQVTLATLNRAYESRTMART